MEDIKEMLNPTRRRVLGGVAGLAGLSSGCLGPSASNPKPIDNYTFSKGEQIWLVPEEDYRVALKYIGERDGGHRFVSGLVPEEIRRFSQKTEYTFEPSETVNLTDWYDNVSSFPMTLESAGENEAKLDFPDGTPYYPQNDDLFPDDFFYE